MNKARRQEIKQLKYKNRLSRIKGIAPEAIKNPKGDRFNLTGYKNHSTPCSCSCCAPYKYKRATLTVLTNRQLEEMRCSAYEYLIP